MPLVLKRNILGKYTKFYNVDLFKIIVEIKEGGSGENEGRVEGGMEGGVKRRIKERIEGWKVGLKTVCFKGEKADRVK